MAESLRIQEADLVCQSCRQFFPSTLLEPGALFPGPQDKSYSFTCANCLNGKISFFHTQKSWSDLASTVLQNLCLRTHQRFFSAKEIREFCHEIHQLCPPSRDTSFRNLFHEFESRPDLYEQSKSRWGLRKLDSESFERDVSEEDDGIEYEKTRQSEIKIGRSSHKASEEKKVKKQQKLFQWCHQCKQKHDHVLHCSRDCNKKYCAKCLHRHYDEKESEIDRDNWICVYCRQICCCAFCRKKKAKLTNTKFESRRGKKRSLSSSWRNSLKRRKTVEFKDEPADEDSLSESEDSVDQSEQNDDVDADDEIDFEEDMKLEVRETPDSYQSPNIFPPPNQIQVAESYFWLKNDLPQSPHLLHGHFEEVQPFQPQNTELIFDPHQFYCEEDGSHFLDSFADIHHPLLHLTEEHEMKREDSSSSSMWADAMLR